MRAYATAETVRRVRDPSLDGSGRLRPRLPRARSLPAQARDSAAAGYDFSQIPMHARPASATANPTDEQPAGEVVTVASDVGVPPPVAAKVPARHCSLASGPTYTPAGNVPISHAGGGKSARFTMAARFRTHAAQGQAASCCEVHQFIKWDQAFATWNGGPPHAGFPAATAAGSWIEDRNAGDTIRYGHRTGTWAVPVAGGNEYKTGATQDMANGDTFVGRDSPGGPSDMVGKFQFRLDVVDTCTGSAMGSSPVITVNWGPPPAPAAHPAAPAHHP